MNSPLVSVLMAAYNSDKYISEAIESVLNSNYYNIELIIVDDKSTDNTLEIALSYQQKDSRINVYSNEINLGDYPNRNKAAGYARGKYLKYLDNDDYLYKYSLNYMVNAMESNPDVGLGIGVKVIDDFKPYPIYLTSKDIYIAEFLINSFLGCGPSAAIIKRECFEKFGGFSGKPYVGDHELWLKLSLKFPVLILQPSLLWYRVHPDQESNRETKKLINRNVRFKLSIEAIKNGKDFFTKSEYEYGLKKIKQNHARLLLKYILLDFKIREGLITWKNSGLTLFELLQGFKKYLK